MNINKTLRFLWLLFTSKDTEQVRQAEIEAFGGGMSDPDKPKKPS